MPETNSRYVEEIFIPPEERQAILSELRQVLQKGTPQITKRFNCIKVCDTKTDRDK